MNSFIDVLQKNWSALVKALLEHIQLSFSAVAIGILIAVPLGIVLTRYPAAGKKVLAALGVLQTVPSMVMFGLLLPISGIGKMTARIVLIIYSILPILRNTYTGISEVSDNYIEAGTGIDRKSVV